MGDRVSSQVCVGNECFDMNAVQDGGFSGSSVHWGPSEQGWSSSGSKPPGTVCREVNGAMVCTNIYAESNVTNFRTNVASMVDKTTALDKQPAVEKTSAKDNVQPASDSSYRESTFDTFPWMVPPQLSAQYGEQTQNNVARINYQEAAPAYYTPQAQENVYKGPAFTQPAQGSDAYGFHQGAAANNRPAEANAAQAYDPYSFHQGREVQPVAPPPVQQDTTGDFRDKPAPPVVKQEQAQPEVQQPVRTCNTPGGCPGQSTPRQNQYNPCSRPCQQSRSAGGWYPGKVVGRIFGGRGRCR